MRTTMPRRIRRGLSRNGRRSARGAAGRAGSVGRVASRMVLMWLVARQARRRRATYRRNVNLASPATPPSHGQTKDAFRGVVWARTRR